MRLNSLWALVAMAPLLTGASEPLHLQPSSQWVVDYGENSCRLIRLFGDGDQQTKLVIESVGGPDLTMLVAGNPVPYGTGSQARFIPVQLSPMQGLSAMTESGKNGAVWSHVVLAREVSLKDMSPAEREEAKQAQKRAAAGLRPTPPSLEKTEAAKAARLQFTNAVTGIELEARLARPLILETGSLTDPLASFDQCMRDLIKSWNLDPDVQEQIVKPAWASRAARWFSSDDFPPQMLAQGASSVIAARLLIDATGKITNCTSLSHFDAPQFNKKVCDIFLARGHYQPAELADGTKVPSFVVQTVIFI